MGGQSLYDDMAYVQLELDNATWKAYGVAPRDMADLQSW